MNCIVALIIPCFGLVTSNIVFERSNKTKLSVPEDIYDHLKREFDQLGADNIRHKERIEKLSEENRKLIFIQRKYEDLQRMCEKANQDRGRLRTDLRNAEQYLYQLEWKVIVQQSVDYYEREFVNLELRQVKSTFKLNQTLLDNVEYDDDYDRIAELRKQRWLFYLNEPPSAFWYFDDLVTRVEKSNYTKEEFARGLAILYKRLVQAIYRDAMEMDKLTARTLSDYDDVKFVIPLLVTQYRKTKPLTRLLDELKPPPPEVEIIRFNLTSIFNSTTKSDDDGCKT